MDATTPLPRALISRTSLLHNVRILRSHLPPHTRLCAVIKADAYGHSAAIVADALTNFSSGPMEAPAVDALAVATLEEAESVTTALGRSIVPLQVLRPIEHSYLNRQRDLLEAAVHHNWTLTVTTPHAARELGRFAASLGKRLSIQLMLDTGMSREGAEISTVNPVVAVTEANAALRLSGICTHLAAADQSDASYTEDQLAQFRAATDAHAERHGNLLRHAANSAALFFCPSSHLDMVRPGLALYGIDPSGRPSVDRALRPVMSWHCPLLAVREVSKGESVGYARAWTARRRSRVGLVPIGYADGYLRAFSPGAMMRIAGGFAPVVGRISMDYASIDLTDIPHAKPGDDVTVLDSDPLSPASVYALADAAGTIPHEVLSGVGPRIARVGIDPADPVEVRDDQWDTPDWTLLGRSA